MSDEEFDCSDQDEDECTNAFIRSLTEHDAMTEDEELKEAYDNLSSYEQLQIKREKDVATRVVQKEKIQMLLEENHWLHSIISTLKQKLKDV